MLRLSRLATLILAIAALSGCHDDAHDEEAKEAQKALGVGAAKETVKSDEKRELLHVKEDKFIDAKTKEVVGTPVKTVTPVTVETKIKQDISVKTGESQVSPPKK